MDSKSFFNQVADEWDKRCIHDRDKINRIIELSDIHPYSKILDAGTGTGILLSYLLEKRPTKITAVDYAENMIKIAKEKYPEPHIEFVIQDIMLFEEKGFDYIFLYSVYPHFDDKEALIIHLTGLLNHGGKLVIAHSESKEKINLIHMKNNWGHRTLLPPAQVTGAMINKYLKVSRIIDNNELYYIEAIYY